MCLPFFSLIPVLPSLFYFYLSFSTSTSTKSNTTTYLTPVPIPLAVHTEIIGYLHRLLDQMSLNSLVADILHRQEYRQVHAFCNCIGISNNLLYSSDNSSLGAHPRSVFVGSICSFLIPHPHSVALRFSPIQSLTW